MFKKLGSYGLFVLGYFTAVLVECLRDTHEAGLILLIVFMLLVLVFLIHTGVIYGE